MDLVVAIMIKNEETSICQTLQPFIDANYINFFIYDTGSTDKTIEVVNTFLKANNTKFIIKEEPFVSFCVSRNKCLDYVVQLFPQCRFVVTLDSEWYIVNAAKIIDYCAAIKIPDEAYLINIKSGSVFGQKRLFANNGKARYHGVVHEYVVSSGNTTLPDDIFFEYRPNAQGHKKTNERWYKDLSLLLEDYHKTKDPRSCFYLAQTYDCLRDSENAIRYYKLRSEIVEGFVEERFMALYRIGIHYEDKDWDNALKYYLKAWQFRPTRIEPLVKIAMHYGEPELKYLYARQACEYPYTTDGLFVDKHLYDYDRWDQLAIGAWYMGAYEEGYKALLKARALKPELSHIQKNYILYRTKLFPEEVYKEQIQKEILLKSLKPLKLLNLILYNENNEFEVKVYNILSQFLKQKGIDHFFYTYKENIEEDFKIVDDIFYIKGSESFRPGILEKTLFAFSHFSKYLGSTYDYIVRTNISTCVNFDLLTSELQKSPVDYGGPLYYTKSLYCPEAGMNEENLKKYENYGFICGLCIVLSKKAIDHLVSIKDELLNYGLVDDTSISIGIRMHKDKLGDFIDKKINGEISWNDSSYKNSNLVYRNKTENNRNIDIENIQKICNSLLSVNQCDSEELDKLYTIVCNTPSDINEHVSFLHDLSTQCNSVVEIGIERFTPTWGFLKGLPHNSKFIGICTTYPNVEVCAKANVLALSKNINFSLIVKDELHINPEEIGKIDMIFIDSIHTYIHVTYQLHKFGYLASKYLVLHDTSDPWGSNNDHEYKGNYSEYPHNYDRHKKGVWTAIEDFLKNSVEWKLKERKLNNHGLTILERTIVSPINVKKEVKTKSTKGKKKN